MVQKIKEYLIEKSNLEEKINDINSNLEKLKRNNNIIKIENINNYINVHTYDNNDKYYLFDKDYNLLFEYDKYLYLRRYANNYIDFKNNFLFFIKDNKASLYDKKNDKFLCDFIILCDDNEVYDLNVFEHIYKYTKNDKYGLIKFDLDKFKVITDAIYDNIISDYYNELLIVKLNDEYFFLDSKGNKISNKTYKELHFPLYSELKIGYNNERKYKYYVAVAKDDVGYFHTYLNDIELYSQRYEELNDYWYKETTPVKVKEGYWKIIDKEGKFIQEFYGERINIKYEEKNILGYEFIKEKKTEFILDKIIN